MHTEELLTRYIYNLKKKKWITNFKATAGISFYFDIPNECNWVLNASNFFQIAENDARHL